MTFVDECTVFLKAGRGGNGSASMHSEPYKPRGGPNGGNGGNGGSIVFEVSRGVHDLSWLADHPHQEAESGKPGRNAKREGASGKDLVVPVPEGTVVMDDQGLVADLVGEGSKAIVAAGGRGGRGNTAFAGPRNRVPRTAEPGEDGDERRVTVELRTVADVGLVGLPNAGKSTLLARLTAAKPKVADYPFTTLTPNLGVAGGDGDRFVVADIPGLVEGASEGKGLGHRFLRHILRCRALVLVVDLAADDPSADLGTLTAELEAYDRDLARRPSIVVGTKTDLVEEPGEAVRLLGPEAIAVSAMTGDGIDELLDRLGLLAKEAEAAEPDRSPYVVLRPGKPRFTVSREDTGRWRVEGRSVERWVLDADLDDDYDVERLQQRLVKEGVERKLASMGARHGDEVAILDRVFEFLPDRPSTPPGPGPGQETSTSRHLEELLATDEARWAELGEVFARIPVDRFEEPTVTPEGWSPKDVMFHVAAWMADAGLQLERMRAGTFDPADETPASIQERNGELFEISRTMDPRDVRAEFAATHQRMCEELGAMPELTPEAVEWFEESGPLHYAKHVDDLRGWLGGAAS